jgi:glutamate synthase domain-containing protein 2
MFLEFIDWFLSLSLWEMTIDIVILALLFFVFYDKYIQRKHQLLINYPVIGRMRYFLEAIREPFRQYFAQEDFYESRDKIEWVYKTSKGENAYASFSPQQPLPKPKFMLQHSNRPLNDDEVSDDFNVLIGKNRKKPFKAKSIIYRSAMSDGAISPEGTRAFTRGAKMGNFPINTGEGSITSNFFITHKNYSRSYMQIIDPGSFHKFMFRMTQKLLNGSVAARLYRWMTLDPKTEESYIFDNEKLVFHRVDWNAPLDSFPKDVPSDMPDVIFQMSSGLYGVRDGDGEFDEDRYQKVMRFCKMTEIKLAQGAKQTGGKLLAEKVTDAIAYYRGVEAHKPIFSPNRFPYANSTEELLDFVGRLQSLSDKPVGFKIVISDDSNLVPLLEEIKRRKDKGIAGVPDFISIDGGDGGTGTAPIALMERVGLHIKDSVFLADKYLKEYGLRDDIKILAASKILTPDDLAIVLALGADMVGIGRGFMMSVGCIRARHCSGAGSMDCPVGLATQNKSKRSSFLVYRNAQQMANYHNGLIKGLKTILAVMGVKTYQELNDSHLNMVDTDGYIYHDINRVLRKKLEQNDKNEIH